MRGCWKYFPFFFFNDTATTEIYTLSLHDALPICADRAAMIEVQKNLKALLDDGVGLAVLHVGDEADARSEENTSELQSRQYLVCRLLLEKKTTYAGASTCSRRVRARNARRRACAR